MTTRKYKIILVKDCDECPYLNWHEVNYSIECELQTDELDCCRQVRYKDNPDAMKELFNYCPLAELCEEECGMGLINSYKRIGAIR